MKKTVKEYFKKVINIFFAGRLVLSGRRSLRGMIALTFDDGPHGEYTKNILDLLRKENVKATFFVVGREAERYPGLLKRMAEEGHEVANHSYAHDKNAGLADIDKAEHAIRNIVGSSSRLFRPPWGKITPGKMFHMIAKGMKMVLWSFDSRDDSLKEPDDLTKYIGSAHIRSGEILLFHDDYKHTVDALPGIIRNIKQRGLGFGTVSELLES